MFFEKTMEAEALRQIPPLSLAYIGDCVYELLVREHTMQKGVNRVAALHKMAVGLVSAEAQAAVAKVITPMLSQEETEVYRRGRNAKPHSIPRHASLAAYAHATALEALLGWLWLSGRQERVREIGEMVIAYFENDDC